MNLQVTVERRNPKMLHTESPLLAQALKTEKADRSLFNLRAKDHLDAALAQATSSSSLAASADCSGKVLKALCLTLSRNAMTSHLLVSA